MGNVIQFPGTKRQAASDDGVRKPAAVASAVRKPLAGDGMSVAVLHRASDSAFTTVRVSVPPKLAMGFARMATEYLIANQPKAKPPARRTKRQRSPAKDLAPKVEAERPSI